jgi:hypothetical protein
MIVALHSNMSAMKCLLKEVGVDVNQAMHDGCTP